MNNLQLRCQATKSDGCLCGAILTGNNIRCGRHKKVFDNKGPRGFIEDEIAYRRRRMMRDWRTIILGREELFILHERITRWTNIAFATFQNMTDQAITDLLVLGGAWFIRGHPEPIAENGVIVELIPLPAPAQPPAGNELGRFVNDNQNVHRKATVDQTIEIVKRVLKIPVPPEYRWNMNTLSKTPAEIITCCKLTPEAGSAMVVKYAANDSIYELGKGIYGKVLDSVWQYISKSDDKEHMCVILKQELQDNVGMCAQGNLSRLCNALAGYMEGIGDIESPAEKLGRLIPPLMEIEDADVRINAVKKLLADVGLPETEWDNWLSACA